MEGGHRGGWCIGGQGRFPHVSGGGFPINVSVAYLLRITHVSVCIGAPSELSRIRAIHSDTQRYATDTVHILQHVILSYPRMRYEGLLYDTLYLMYHVRIVCVSCTSQTNVSYNVS